MRATALLCLLLASCKGVDLVPFVGASAYTNDEQAVHAGVSFVPSREVAQERPSFRSWRDDGALGASDERAGSSASKAQAGRPGDSGLDVLAATGEWAEYLRRQGWSVAAPGPPTQPVKPEDDGGVHLSPTALATIVTVIAAVLGGSHIKGGPKAT